MKDLISVTQFILFSSFSYILNKHRYNKIFLLRPSTSSSSHFLSYQTRLSFFFQKSFHTKKKKKFDETIKMGAWGVRKILFLFSFSNLFMLSETTFLLLFSRSITKQFSSSHLFLFLFVFWAKTKRIIGVEAGILRSPCEEDMQSSVWYMDLSWMDCPCPYTSPINAMVTTQTQTFKKEDVRPTNPPKECWPLFLFLVWLNSLYPILFGSYDSTYRVL